CTLAVVAGGGKGSVPAKSWPRNLRDPRNLSDLRTLSDLRNLSDPRNLSDLRNLIQERPDATDTARITE
ncbi:hypothetical protein ACMWP8_29325, partial [Escherichia coli]|uniref:hypothetical protein n=1 Tax=Escherichia coli TaxID=562 RepID=UPI0039E19C7F